MQLIAVPFVPTHAEYIYLSGRRILADQMEFYSLIFRGTVRFMTGWATAILSARSVIRITASADSKNASGAGSD